MKTLNYKSKLTAVIALVVIATAGAALRTRAQDQQPPPVNDRHALFGLLGITHGQTARLSVANLEPPPIGDFPPGPTRVEMSFVDADGHFTVANLDPLRQSGWQKISLSGGNLSACRNRPE